MDKRYFALSEETFEYIEGHELYDYAQDKAVKSCGNNDAYAIVKVVGIVYKQPITKQVVRVDLEEPVEDFENEEFLKNTEAELRKHWTGGPTLADAETISSLMACSVIAAHIIRSRMLMDLNPMR
tara:strand:+ start:1012 stop:1386 length:375 start_codon:yes stop_codon:yes gene_type:complete